MRTVLALDAVLILGGVVAAIVFWTGVSSAASVAVALGGFGLALAVPLGMGQLGNWGVPGDEPPLRRSTQH